LKFSLLTSPKVSAMMVRRIRPVQLEPKSSPEFDQYAAAYAALLHDPARSSFASDPLHFHRRKWSLLQKLFAQLKIAPAELRWLDVGCGQGELLDLAGGSFARAAGCDLSAGMLSASSLHETVQQKTPTDLPFADQSFDFITAVCVFHHVEEEQRSRLIAEIRRVLVPGGHCCLIEHNPWNPVTHAIVKRCPVDVDARLLTLALAKRLFAAGGFKPVSRKYFLFLPESLHRRVAALENGLTWLPLGGQYALVVQSPKSFLC
jgi:SAM-dependent methyltransferase